MERGLETRLKVLERGTNVARVRLDLAEQVMGHAEALLGANAYQVLGRQVGGGILGESNIVQITY